MKKSRIKIALQTITTRDEAEATMNALALAENNRRKLIARRDDAVLRINENYAAEIAACDQTVNEHTDTLRAWAESNPAEFPKDRKSIKLLAGVLGFRTGTPKLALLSRAFKWENVLNLVRERLPGFIRIKEEVDKEGLISATRQGTIDSDADTTFTPVQLAEVGLKITQDESFFVEPDLTPFEDRITTCAN